jgi:4-hydroxy-4-methyl-2-oxoglutarate aldolase
MVPGSDPIASQKNGPAVVGGTGAVSLGGTIIHNGDLVIADEDGVVIWPQEHIDDLLVRARTRLEQDNARLAKLQKGKKEFPL